MQILKDIPELVKAGVITPDAAEKIKDYYKKRGGHGTNRLFIVFGILGAILVGLGIILIIAHNWDDLSRTAKTAFAFLPLLTGQLLCGFVLLRRRSSIAWRESSTAFLFCAVGASIALVSQIYNIPGDFSAFLITWMLLCLPLVYVMQSSMAALLFLIGITSYATETAYWSFPFSGAYAYWGLLLLVLPDYYLLYKRQPQGNFMRFHNWLVPLSIATALGTVAESNEEWMFIAYFSLLGLYYLIGNMKTFASQKVRNNAYKTIGSLGTIFLLLALSFDWFWQELRDQYWDWSEVFTSPEFVAATVLSLLAGAVLYRQKKAGISGQFMPIEVVFIAFIFTYIIGLYSLAAVVLINIIVFAVGIFTIRDGAKRNHLGVLNYGLLILTALVICRFFDTDLSFVIRGMLFVAVGTGFFLVNYRMLKKRKTNEQ